MKLVLVRHLPTAWNRVVRLQGRRDIPLDQSAEPSAAELAKQTVLLASLGPFDLVACSTLQRTRQTAALFGYPDPQPDPLLDEFDFGKWEGVLRSDFMVDHGEAWMHAPETLDFGENVVTLGRRVSAFVEKHRACGAVLVFGHGAWIRAARALHDTGSVSTMNQRDVGNGEAIVLEYPSTPPA